MSVSQKIGNNIFSISSALLVVPLIISVIINFIFFGLRNYYLLVYLNLITQVIITMILGVLCANPTQPIVYVKYYCLSSFINTFGTLLYALEINPDVDSGLKIVSLWILSIGYLVQLRKTFDWKEVLYIAITFIIITCIIIGLDLGVVYYVARRITMELAYTVMWSILFAIPTSAATVLTSHMGINSENLIEKITTFPIFISYCLEIILLYITTRYRSLFEGTFLMPTFQSFIWIHYIILSLTIIIVNIKYDVIKKKDLIRKEKKQLKLQQKEIRMKNILENIVFV